jgi:hypothetical protein
MAPQHPIQSQLITAHFLTTWYFYICLILPFHVFNKPVKSLVFFIFSYCWIHFLFSSCFSHVPSFLYYLMSVGLQMWKLVVMKCIPYCATSSLCSNTALSIFVVWSRKATGLIRTSLYREIWGSKVNYREDGSFWRVHKIATSDYYLFHFCPIGRPSVLRKQLGCYCTDFDEIWYLSFFIFEHLSRKFKFY